jgi:hypothetical protein
MYLVYIDDSQDQATRTYVFSAVVIIDTRWKEIFANIRQYRRQLKQTDGIFVTNAKAPALRPGPGKQGLPSPLKTRSVLPLQRGPTAIYPQASFASLRATVSASQRFVFYP